MGAEGYPISQLLGSARALVERSRQLREEAERIYRAAQTTCAQSRALRQPPPAGHIAHETSVTEIRLYQHHCRAFPRGMPRG